MLNVNFDFKTTGDTLLRGERIFYQEESNSVMVIAFILKGILLKNDTLIIKEREFNILSLHLRNEKMLEVPEYEWVGIELKANPDQLKILGIS